MRFLLVVLCSAALCAQQTVEGTVTDESAARVPGAAVALGGGIQANAVTNAEGVFRFVSVPAGDYRLTVTREGFAPYEEKLTVTGAVTRSIVLAASPIAETVQVVSRVAEPTFRSPYFVSTVTKDELTQQPPATFDDVLRSVPGLQHGTQGNAFTRVATRGQRDTADVLTLIDGVPLRQFNGSADLTMVPIQLVQDVEFVKGPASTAYGRSAVAGVMNFNTVPEPRPGGEDPTGFLAGNLASFRTFEGFGGVNLPFTLGKLPRGNFGAAAVASDSDGFQDRTGRTLKAASMQLNQPLHERVNLRIHYLSSDVLAGRGSIIPLENGRPLYGITREQNFGIPGAKFDGTLNTVTPRVDLDLGHGFQATQMFNFNRYWRYSTGGITILPGPGTSNKGWNESDATQDTWLADTLVQHRWANRTYRSHFLTGYTYEKGTQDSASPAFANAPTYRGPDYATPVTNAAVDPKGVRGAVTTSYFNQGINSFYFQERFELDRVGLTGGMRYDGFDQALTRTDTAVRSAQVKSRWSPRVGLDLLALQRRLLDISLFGNYVEGFRPQTPALSVLNNLVVPQLLRPEVTKNVETGVRARMQRGTTFQASWFHMRKVDGQRSFRSGPDDFFFVNATSRVKGVESELRSRFRKHFVWLHYSFQDTRHIEFRPTQTTNFSGFRLRMAPRHIYGLGGILHITEGLTFSPSLNYTGARPLRDNIVNPQILPSYTLVGFNVAYSVKRWQVTGGVTNVGDVYYIGDDFSAQNAGNAGMPRRFNLQVRYRF